MTHIFALPPSLYKDLDCLHDATFFAHIYSTASVCLFYKALFRFHGRTKSKAAQDKSSGAEVVAKINKALISDNSVSG